MRHSQMSSREACSSMPLEPNAWYAVRRLHYGGPYEYALIRQGISINTLYKCADALIEREAAFIWIERLTDDEVREMGL